MANTLPLNISMGALPPAVEWTPQQLADAIAARLSITTQQTFALFVTGSTEPSSNVGPWLKNGNEWYVWSDTAGGYVPITIAQESLGYFIGEATPDPTVYQFWIRTTAGGSPLGISIYYSGSWVDVYAAQLANYLTISAYNASIANYSTTAQMNSAISAAISGIPATNLYPTTATNNSTQAIPVDGVSHQLTLDSAPVNPGGAFNTGLGRFVAPSTGYYGVSANAQFDNDTGVASGMTVILNIYKNGADAGIGGIDATPSPNGSRWFPTFGSIIIQLNQNDYIDLRCTLNDGTNTGSVDMITADFSVFRVG